MSFEKEALKEQIADKYGRRISQDMRSQAKATTDKQSGKLGRSFRHSVMTRGGDVEGITFKTFRYAYILNTGMEKQEIYRRKSRKSLGTYTHKGFKGKGFISDPIDRHIDAMATEISEVDANAVLNTVRYDVKL